MFHWEDSVYQGFLDLHNVVRWVVLLLGVAALVAAWLGAMSGGRWTKTQAGLGRWFSIAFDVQVLLGLVLYFALSRITTNALRDFGAAMSDSNVRFFAVEHSLMMIIAAVLVHIGVARGKRADRALPAAIFYTIAVVLVIVAVPWGARLFPGV